MGIKAYIINHSGGVEANGCIKSGEYPVYLWQRNSI